MSTNHEKWFAIFGDGATWIQATLNTILGVFFAIGIVIFIIKLITTSIKAKVSEDEETKAMVRKLNVKNVFALVLLMSVAIITFTLINIMPAPSKPNTSSFFDIFKGAKEDAQKYFNLTISILIGMAVIIYIVIMPIRLIKFMNADDEGKLKLRKAMVSSTWWMGAIVLVLFIANVVLNVVPSPTSV